MHCKVNRQLFLQKFRLLATVAQMNKRDEILGSGLIFSLQPDEVTLMATNGQSDLRLTVRENFEFLVAGRAILPAKTLVDLFAKIEGEMVELEVNKNGLEIRATNYKCTLKTIDEAQFPALDWEWEHPDPLTFPREFLRVALKKVGGTVDNGTEQTKALQTMLFEAVDGQLTVLATDAVKLSVLRIPWEQRNFKIWVEPNILKVVAELAAVKFFVSSSASTVYFSGDDWYLKYQMFEGEYPNISRIFQLEMPHQFAFRKQDLVLALDRGVQLGSDPTTAVKCIIKRKVLELQFLTQLGQSQDVIAIDGSEDDRVIFNFNAPNLLRLIRNFAGVDLVWLYHDPSRPIFLTDPREPAFLQVIFPLRNFQ